MKYRLVITLILAVICYNQEMVNKLVKEADFTATCRARCRYYGSDKGIVDNGKCYCGDLQSDDDLYEKRLILPKKYQKSKYEDE
jgi:hypothetical protein